MDPHAILLIDESSACVKVISSIVQRYNDMDIVATAADGATGMSEVRKCHPQLVICSVTLPDMPPEDIIEDIARTDPFLGIIFIVSAQDKYSLKTNVDKLKHGNVDLFEINDDPEQCSDTSTLERFLIAKIRQWSIKYYSRIAKGNVTPKSMRPQDTQVIKTDALAKAPPPSGRPQAPKMVHPVLIGASTGGPDALKKVIPLFPALYPFPVIVVIHMPELFTKRYAESLNKESALTVSEATYGEAAEAGHAYIAPGGHHLVLTKETRNRLVFAADDGPPENGCKPSVDVFFRSAAEVLHGNCTAVVLTGMGCDGTKGLGTLKTHGVRTIVQDRETSVVWGMPGSAVEAGLVDKIVPLDNITRTIVGFTDKVI